MVRVKFKGRVNYQGGLKWQICFEIRVKSQGGLNAQKYGSQIKTHQKTFHSQIIIPIHIIQIHVVQGLTVSKLG